MLAMIVIKNMDAREALQKYKEQMVKNIKSGVKYINYGMNLDWVYLSFVNRFLFYYVSIFQTIF